MISDRKLHLHEEIMLLALRDRKGTVAASSTYTYAIGGAALAEMLLVGRIAIQQERKKTFVRLVDGRPFADPLLDACLGKLAASRKRAQIRTWVTRFAGTKNLKHLVAGRLAGKGILRVDQDKVLGIFTRTVYPELDPRPERALIARLEKAIFTDQNPVDVRTAVLVTLAHRADLLKLVIDRKRLKQRRERIERIGNGDLIGKATGDAIQAMQTALMAATMVPVIVAATASTN